MKRAAAALLGVLLLGGCGKITESSCGDLLAESAAEAVSRPCDTPNCTKELYAYYLPPEIGRLSGNEAGNLFCWNGTMFVMNLNVSDVLRETYFQEAPEEEPVLDREAAVFSLDGTYEDSAGGIGNFRIMIHDLGGVYSCDVRTDKADFFAVTDLVTAVTLPAKMLRIARSMRTDTQAIAAAFSTKSAVSYEARRIQLFENLAPVNGTIDELLIDGGDGAGKTEDTVPEDASQPQNQE